MLKKSPLEVSVAGRNMVLWRNKDQQVVMQDNYCPHRGAKLSMGKVNKSCIECPYHGWTFDDSGVLKNVPSCESNLVGGLKLDTLQTMESGGLIWFCTGNPTGYNPPVIKEMHDKNWVSVTGQAVFQNDWLSTLENSIDITHVNFVHSDFGNSQNGEVKEVDIVSKANDMLRMYSTINHKSDNLLLKFTENPNVRVRHDILLPNTVSIQFWVQDILKVITYVTYTPITENKTLMNWVFLRSPKMGPFDPILNHFFVDGMKKAIEEDQEIVNSLVNPQVRVNVPPDVIQNTFRRKLAELKLSEPTFTFD